MQRLFWTLEEDTLLENLYLKNASAEQFISALPKRSLSAIRSRTHVLIKEGMFAKRRLKQKPINTANFSNKYTKRQLEKDAVKVVDKTGGWFGIPGPAIIEHWDVFKSILRDKSPFIAVEENKSQYNKMSRLSENINGLTLVNGELFNVLKSFGQLYPSPRVPLFAYGHLDFCKTARILLRDYELYSNLMWLAQWNQIKSVFYLDVSVSRRPDDDIIFTKLFQDLIPFIFSLNGWNVTDPRNLQNKYIKTYSDGNPMVNALFKMTKIK